MGPSSPATLAALLLMFGAAVAGMLRFSRWYARVPLIAATFLTAAACGISAVNAYYDYYQSWSALAADIGNDNGTAAVPIVVPVATPRPNRYGGTDVNGHLDAGSWTSVRVQLPGPVSGVTGRSALALLPPGYASLARAGRMLPVLELLHGDPGHPGTWTNGVQIVDALRRATSKGDIGPMVVLLPDVHGSIHDQQCLDVHGGPRLASWLVNDVPRDVQESLAVYPPGKHWLLGGLSEGGFCATDLVLRHPEVWQGAAVLDGYFHPYLSKTVLRRVYGGSRQASTADDTTDTVKQWPLQSQLPVFWLMAGTANASDYHDAIAFATLLGTREDPRFVTVIRGRHSAPAWRAALPDLLRWAWATLDGGDLNGSIEVPLH